MYLRKSAGAAVDVVMMLLVNESGLDSYELLWLREKKGTGENRFSSNAR